MLKLFPQTLLQHFFRVYIASYLNTRWVGKIRDSYANRPLTTSRVCITFENSPNPPSLRDSFEKKSCWAQTTVLYKTNGPVSDDVTLSVFVVDVVFVFHSNKN